MIRVFAVALVAFNFCILTSATAQTLATPEQIRKDLSFVNHLMDDHQDEEALFELERIKKIATEPTLLDSIEFLLGWNHYSGKRLEMANKHFLNVSTNSTQYLRSRFYTGFNYAYMRQDEMALNILQNDIANHATDSSHIKLMLFEHAGISLLNRDYDGYDKYMGQLGSSKFYAIDSERLKMNTYKQQLLQAKNRKPWKAALFSAIIPGSGKMYAGKTNEGVASFVLIGILGGSAYEAYRDNTARPPTRFWIFSSLFTIFYFGNILGSYYTVRIVQDEFNDEMDHKIMFDMHIPIRTVFN